MKALPDLDDVQAMAAWGRRSALMQAWKHAKEALRDASTHSQSVDSPSDADMTRFADDAIKAANRLKEVSGLWKYVDDDGLTATLKASIDLAKEKRA